MAWMRSLRSGARRWAGRGIDILYPPRCPFCDAEEGPEQAAGAAPGGDADRRSEACPRCARELSADVGRCLRCGEPGPARDGCRRCRGRRREWGRTVVLSAYAGRLREAVLRAKRPAGDAVAAALGALIARHHGGELAALGADLVVPVPMHWLRRSIRGASAADRMAERVATLLGLPHARTLVRRRATRMQNTLPVGRRAANVEGAFSCRRRLDGRRVLLVDDVMTTGATLGACARTLRAAGALGVDVAVAARADAAGGDFDDP